jgi:hypothetical protein
VAIYHLQLKDMRDEWTMVRIDDDDDEWRQHKRTPPPKKIGSGSGDCTFFIQLLNLMDGETGHKLVQLYTASNQKIRQGTKGSGMCGGTMPALKDGPIEWTCTAYYADEDDEN